MKFKRRARQDTDVNMMPLIDIVFLLLIFFMVSTTFTKESRLGLKLPQAKQSAPATIEAKKVEVIIDAQGVFYVEKQRLLNNDKVSVKQALKAELEKAFAENGKVPSLVISADAATAHQFVVRTMDLAGQLGFAKLSISTLKLDN
jgi:biopolymer transport protein ExbD